jgi:asparagine synthase (glutamine-hydrolysing)
MSGIVGIVNLDGAPVDRRLLQRMTEFMTFRGPDAQEIWINNHVGFGHTMLRTTEESADERQPHTLDGQVWITADARIDGREDLVRKLKGKGCGASLSAPDAELILSAYQVWGEDCVAHLLGDFAFAIWDGQRQRLFCARDHFGVKPFFYTQAAEHFVFSNTLNCVRLHRAVSDELNEQAIGDFLLFNGFQDLAMTAFADIQRLPPAHSLTWSEGNLSLRRYWTLPDGDLIRYRHKSDYIEQFLELLNTAVSDRLRTNNIGVLMSGGLDSPAVAAAAGKLLKKQSGSCDLQAHTVVFDRLFPDEERKYAGMVAEALKIPIHFLVADDYPPYEGANSPELQQPEPTNDPFLRKGYDLSKHLAAHHRVVLTGSDADTILGELPNYYFGYLFRKLNFGRLLFEMARYAWFQREMPRIGLRAWLRRLAGKRWVYECPAWLNQAFAERLNLKAKLEEANREKPQHPFRPLAYRILALPRWAQHFEEYDAGLTMFPVEYRHPFADQRLLNFALSLPPAPWLIKKRLMRVALQGVLPDPICSRPKSPLNGDMLIELLREQRSHWVDEFEPLPALAGYVEIAAIPPLVGENDSHRLWMNARPLSLHYWLASSKPVSNKPYPEEKNETRYCDQIG